MSERWRIVCDREGCDAELELPLADSHAPRRLLMIAKAHRWQIITTTDLRSDFCPAHHVPELAERGELGDPPRKAGR